MSNETFLITGAMGCIGAWVLRNLIDEDVTIVAADLVTDPVRPGLLMLPAVLERVTLVQLDITDSSSVRRVVEQNEVTHIIHLAALQVLFCKANPEKPRSSQTASSVSASPDLAPARASQISSSAPSTPTASTSSSLPPLPLPQIHRPR